MNLFYRYLMLSAFMLISLCSSVYGDHFVPVWSTPYYPMTIFVKDAKFNGVPIQANNEIGVFDGTKCVGYIKLTQSINPGSTATYAQIVVSQDDDSGNGFTPGHTITYKYWIDQTATEIENITPEYNAGSPFDSPVFTPGETTIAELSVVKVTLSFQVKATSPACFGYSNGQITVTAGGGTSPYYYSIDNGTNWQSSNIFNSLAAGDYYVRVKDSGTPTPLQSAYPFNPVVLHYPAELVIESVIAEGPWPGRERQGKITILAKGGTGTLHYSINNGADWYENNVFANLKYLTLNKGDIQVKDDMDCITKYQLMILMDVKDEYKLSELKVYPNPAQNLINLSINTAEEDCLVEIINVTGQVVYSSHLAFLYNEIKEINTGNLQNGFHILMVRDRNGFPAYRNFLIIK